MAQQIITDDGGGDYPAPATKPAPAPAPAPAPKPAPAPAPAPAPKPAPAPAPAPAPKPPPPPPPPPMVLYDGEVVPYSTYGTPPPAPAAPLPSGYQTISTPTVGANDPGSIETNVIELANLSVDSLGSIGFNGPAVVSSGSGESYQTQVNPDLTAYLADQALTVAKTVTGATYTLQTFDQAGATVGSSTTGEYADDTIFGAVIAVIATLATAGIATGAIYGEAAAVGLGASEAAGVAVADTAWAVPALEAAAPALEFAAPALDVAGLTTLDAAAYAAAGDVFLPTAGWVGAVDAAWSLPALTETAAPEVVDVAGLTQLESEAYAASGTGLLETGGSVAAGGAWSLPSLPTVGQVVDGAGLLSKAITAGSVIAAAVTGKPTPATRAPATTTTKPNTGTAAASNSALGLIATCAAVFFAIKGF